MKIEYKRVGDEMLWFRKEGEDFPAWPSHFPKNGCTDYQYLSAFVSGLEFAGVKVDEFVEVEW